MSEQKYTILVTGGAGYIGSHAVLALKQAGYQVVIFDNLEYGHQELVKSVLDVELVIGDTRDRSSLDRVFDLFKIPVTIIEKADAIELPRITGKIDYQDVSFGYTQGKSILKSFDLNILPDETSWKRFNKLRIVLLPAPEVPTRAIVSPDLMVRLKSLRIGLSGV